MMGKLPSIRQLEYLVAISDARHFRRAAEKAGVSQPTLSAQLQALEAHLGVKLVERSRARVIMTPVGTEIATRARTVLRDVQGIADLARHGQNLLGGAVRLGTIQSLGPYLLPHILPELHEKYPDLRLYVREATPRVLLGGLEDGTFDLLLFPLPVRAGDLSDARLYREPLWIVAPSGHPMESKGSIEHSDIKGETILALEEGNRLRDQVRDLCDEYGANLSLDYEGTSLDTLRQMVGMGMGLSFLPALYVRSEVAQDRQVVARPMRTRPPSRTIGMVWRRNSGRQDEFLALAALIRTILKERVPEIMVLE
jgi:LysR family hydrogen peroxide-inducible transcriptional activator